MRATIARRAAHAARALERATPLAPQRARPARQPSRPARWILDRAPREVRKLLDARISELGLTIAGSPVERYVAELHRELARKGLRFRPTCYLSDEWGCPSGEPVIGIPFYLADPRLARLEREMNDLEDEREIMSYLRHEAGHAINYAYRLYRMRGWQRLFGPFEYPYRDRYRPVPFSRHFVRHLPGWYAQKHPDEDFAETFAVWLTPRSPWRRRYAGWPAMRKLLWVDAFARGAGRREPPVPTGDVDLTVDAMDITVGEFYARALEETRVAEFIDVDADLEQIFVRATRPDASLEPASTIIERHRLALTNTITSWTGASRPLVRRLVRRMARQARALRLYGAVDRTTQYLVELTAFGTTLAMHYVANRR